MVELGYALSSEDHPPADLIRFAAQHGFSYGLVSDHFHPWNDAQGQASFVWSVLGGIAQATETFRIGTGVTCPLIRTHPAIVAQAAATTAALMPGRFFLGVGTGENLNEHVTGARWPAPDERVAMLEEAIELIRLLWQGGLQSYDGEHYRLDHARLYTLPDEPPDLMVAAASPHVAELAGRLGDGLINVAPDREIVERFEAAGGTGPRYGMIHVCWHEDEAAARKLAHELWPNLALGGSLGQELKLPEDFEAASEPITEDAVAEEVPCGNDPERHLEKIRAFVDAGYDHVYMHQIGEDQEGFMRFYQCEIAPAL